MVFTHSTEYGSPFRGVVTGFQEANDDRFPWNVVCDFIGDTLGPIPGWTIPWQGADDPVFAVVCPD